MRAGRKGHFISTPNFWFPLEPHYHMAFFQFLPELFKRWLVRHLSFSWRSSVRYERIALVTPARTAASVA